MTQTLRDLALDLLDDDHGISMDAWTTLYTLAEQEGVEFQDIIDATGVTEWIGGRRVYLPDEHGIEA